MPADKVVFDRHSAGRIADAVRKVEASSEDVGAREAPTKFQFLFPWHKIGFGFRLGGDPSRVLGSGPDKVMIYEGEVQYGLRGYYSTPDSVVTLTADHQYVGVQFDTTNMELSLIAPTTTKPESESFIVRWWLYLFRYNPATKVADVEKFGYFGNREITGALA